MEGAVWAEGKAKDGKTVMLVHSRGRAKEQFISEFLQDPREWYIQDLCLDIIYGEKKIGYVSFAPHHEDNEIYKLVRNCSKPSFEQVSNKKVEVIKVGPWSSG